MYTRALVVRAVLFPGLSVKGGGRRGRKSNFDVEHMFSETEQIPYFCTVEC